MIARGRTSRATAAATLSVLLVVPASAHAQDTPPVPDSVLEGFVRDGIHSPWPPTDIFVGCAETAPWQLEAFTLLSTAPLPAERESELALAWMTALRDCRNPGLESWFLDHAASAIARNDRSDLMMRWWSALEFADSPRIRSFLWSTLTDPLLPEGLRSQAGTSLFKRFEPDERLSEYVRAFESRSMPRQFALSQGQVILTSDADRLLRELGARVQRDPGLVSQPAFALAVESSDRYAAPGTREELGRSLDQALAGSGLGAEERRIMSSFARQLRKRRPGT